MIQVNKIDSSISYKTCTVQRGNQQWWPWVKVMFYEDVQLNNYTTEYTHFSYKWRWVSRNCELDCDLANFKVIYRSTFSMNKTSHFHSWNEKTKRFVFKCLTQPSTVSFFTVCVKFSAISIHATFFWMIYNIFLHILVIWNFYSIISTKTFLIILLTTMTFSNISKIVREF